ncbi:MAG: FecR domain-containing protein [Planctomycetota bacterium]
MNRDDVSPQERIDQYLLGQATAEDVEILNELLSNDEQLRKIYRFRVALEGGYREAAIRSEDPEPFGNTSIPQVKPSQTSGRVLPYAIAIAAALAAGLLFAVTRWNVDDRRATAPDAYPASKNTVARLVASVDADWLDIDPVSGTWLDAGKFRLDAGTVELEFNRGARVTLQGPSVFELKHSDLMHVSSGNLVARIPEEAIGFTITTDEAEVVDLGTEFGMRVEDGRQTEVHVIEGLVEVFERQAANDSGATDKTTESFRVEEGQAIRLNVDATDSIGSRIIPLRSRRSVLGVKERSDLGLTFLRGNVRLKESVGRADLKRQVTSWIEVIPEKKSVQLKSEVPVTMVSPGHYRIFGDSGQVIPAGTKIDSYLLHFRSTQPSPIHGVIKFDQEIVGLVCDAEQLAISDPIVGRNGMSFPVASQQYRGLEPRVQFDNPNVDRGGGWTPDEVTVSKDRKTVGLSVNVNPRVGVDQLRVLVRSKN